jgi:hypothetical protein
MSLAPQFGMERLGTGRIVLIADRARQRAHEQQTYQGVRHILYCALNMHMLCVSDGHDASLRWP